MRGVGTSGLLLLVAAGAGGCGRDVRVQDLAPPALEWAQGNGLCSKIVAVDGHGQVWRDEGCESPVTLDAVRVISASEVDNLWALFGALPQRSFGDIQGCQGNSHWFQRYDNPNPPTTAAVTCTAATVYDDVSDLPGEFRRMAEALIAVQ